MRWHFQIGRTLVHVWLYNGTFSPVIFVLFLVLLSLFCVTQMKKKYLATFVKRNLALINKNIFKSVD